MESSKRSPLSLFFVEDENWGQVKTMASELAKSRDVELLLINAINGQPGLSERSWEKITGFLMEVWEGETEGFSRALYQQYELQSESKYLAERYIAFCHMLKFLYSIETPSDFEDDKAGEIVCEGTNRLLSSIKESGTDIRSLKAVNPGLLIDIIDDYPGILVDREEEFEVFLNLLGR